MDEEVDDNLVHEVGFGKGGGFAGESTDSLAQGAVKAFDVVGWPVGFALVQRFRRHNTGISLPNIGKAAPGFVSLRNPAPEDATGFYAPAP